MLRISALWQFVFGSLYSYSIVDMIMMKSGSSWTLGLHTSFTIDCTSNLRWHLQLMITSAIMSWSSASVGKHPSVLAIVPISLRHRDSCRRAVSPPHDHPNVWPWGTHLTSTVLLDSWSNTSNISATLLSISSRATSSSFNSADGVSEAITHHHRNRGRFQSPVSFTYGTADSISRNLTVSGLESTLTWVQSKIFTNITKYWMVLATRCQRWGARGVEKEISAFSYFYSQMSCCLLHCIHGNTCCHWCSMKIPMCLCWLRVRREMDRRD